MPIETDPLPSQTATKEPSLKSEETTTQATATPEGKIYDSTFADVVGLEDIKQILRETIGWSLEERKNPDKDKDSFKMYGRKRELGMILYGAPGNGKTHIMRATSGEFKIRLIVANIDEIISSYVGDTAKNIAELFKKARENLPCIIFFDEFDALGRKRSGSGTDAEANALKSAVNQLLTEMDGIEKRGEDLFIVAATNLPWEVDPALKRGNRFENMEYVAMPNLSERNQLLKLYLKDVRPDILRVNTGRIARATRGWTCADLLKVIKAAKREAHRRYKEKGGKPAITTGLVASLVWDTQARGESEWFGNVAEQFATKPGTIDAYPELYTEAKRLSRDDWKQDFIRIFSLWVI